MKAILLILLVIYLGLLKKFPIFFEPISSQVDLSKFFIIILFFDSVLKGYRQRKSIAAFLGRNFVLLFFLLVNSVELFKVQVPFVSEHKLEVILGLFLGSVFLHLIRTKSLSKAIGQSLPEKTVNLSRFERKLRRATIKFVKRTQLQLPETLQSQWRKPLERKIYLLSLVISFLMVAIFIALYRYSSLPLIAQVLIWTLLPYFLTWPLGGMMLCREVKIEEDHQDLILRGIFDLTIKKSEVLRVEPYQSPDRGDFNFCFMTEPLVRVVLKEPSDLQVVNTTKKVHHILLPFQLSRFSELGTC